MQEGKFLKIIIVCLLVLNIGTLGYLWTGREHRRPDRMRDENAGEMLNQELKLSDAQEEQYRKMRGVHHAGIRAITRDIEAEQRRLYQTLSVSPPDTARAAVIIDSMVAGQREMYLMTYRHFRELRAICSPGQQRRFDEVIQEALSKIRELRGKKPPQRDE